MTMIRSGLRTNYLVEREWRRISPSQSLAVAARECEYWLLGAKESLKGTRGIRADATAPDNPEGLRDGKGHLTRDMDGDRGYVDVEDQAALTTQRISTRPSQHARPFEGSGWTCDES
jgi:hypothetical protein